MPIPVFLLPLLSKGLDLVANAALAKGKQWVKEKTGVDVDEANMSEENLLKLKKFQLDNQLELERMKQDDDKLDAELQRMYLADVQNARLMQMSALGQEDKFSKRFVYYFAIAWSAFSMAYLGFITFGHIPEVNTRFADTVLGFLLGTIVSTIVGYFYGSSRSSGTKDGLLAEVVKKATGK